jgi:hypothetical protein
MAYQVTFTLNALYTGTTEADNFTIVGKHSNGSPADTTIATGVAKSDLTAGVTYQVADTITGGTVTSTGTCTNSVNWTGQGAPEPTAEPTATPGPTPGETLYYQFTYCDSGDQPQGVTTVDVSSDELEAAGYSALPSSGSPTLTFQGLGGCYEYREVEASSSDGRLILSVNECTCDNPA